MKGSGRTRGVTPPQLPTTRPLPPQSEVWGSPRPPTCPGLVRANCSLAAGVEPPGAWNAREGTGRRCGDAPRSEATLSVPRLGNSQPKEETQVLVLRGVKRSPKSGSPSLLGQWQSPCPLQYKFNYLKNGLIQKRDESAPQKQT